MGIGSIVGGTFDRMDIEKGGISATLHQGVFTGELSSQSVRTCGLFLYGTVDSGIFRDKSWMAGTGGRGPIVRRLGRLDGTTGSAGRADHHIHHIITPRSDQTVREARSS